MTDYKKIGVNHDYIASDDNRDKRIQHAVILKISKLMSALICGRLYEVKTNRKAWAVRYLFQRPINN